MIWNNFLFKERRVPLRPIILGGPPSRFPSLVETKEHLASWTNFSMMSQSSCVFPDSLHEDPENVGNLKCVFPQTPIFPGSSFSRNGFSSRLQRRLQARGVRVRMNPAEGTWHTNPLTGGERTSRKESSLLDGSVEILLRNRIFRYGTLNAVVMELKM